MSLQGAFAYAYLNALRQDENARIYGRLAGWLACLAGLAGLGGLVGWLVRQARDGRDGLKLSSTRKESVHTLPFRRFPRWSFSFSMLQVPSTLSVKGVAGPDQTFHPTPLSPLLFSSLLPPNTVSPSPHFLSRLLFFSCISCSPPFSLSIYFFFLSFLSFLLFSFCTGLNTGRNEAVKMFRHAQFIIGCEW